MRPSSRSPLLASALLALAGCAQQEHTDMAPSAPNMVTVRAVDHAFEAPAEIPAGLTTFTLVNAGATFHHLLLARIDSGKTFADAQAALMQPGPPPGWLTLIGGPNSPEPNAESNATFDLPAGSYALFCMVDIPGGIPHVAQGMSRALTVTPSSAPSAPAPVADVKLSLFDYNFTLSAPLSAGAHTFEVTLQPGQPHEVELLQLAPGKTANDFMAWMEKMEGPPPARAVGGVVVGQPGSPMYFTADMPAGEYVLICFLPDGKDGQPHFMHGMMQTITVS